MNLTDWGLDSLLNERYDDPAIAADFWASVSASYHRTVRRRILRVASRRRRARSGK